VAATAGRAGAGTPVVQRLLRWLRRNVRGRLERARNSREDFDYAQVQDELIVYHHLGLGDHFVCMGLVLELAERYARRAVHLPVKHAYLDTVRTLYARAPQVQVFGIDGDAAEQQVYERARRLQLRVARLGFAALDRVHWDRSFYDLAGLDFGLSWSRFSPGDAGADADALFERLVHSKPYLLIHDDGSVGRFALRLPAEGERLFVRPEPGASGLLAWSRIIREASQIHCIDSSVVHLVDRMPRIPGQQLFLHDARHSGCTFVRRHDWKLIEYPP